MPAAVEAWLVDLVHCRDGLLTAEAATARLAPSHDLVPGSERHLSHIALRVLLARAAGPGIARVPFEIDPGGRPELPGRPVRFSLSHTSREGRALALVAVGGDGPLGVDLELSRPLRLGPSHQRAIARAGSALRPADRQLDDDDTGTLCAWTRLEALAKADGCGMARVLTRLGARGHGDLPAAEVAARAAAMLARLGAAVHDLSFAASADPDPASHAASRVFAAIAMGAGLPLPAPRAFPARPELIGALAVSNDA